MHEEVRVEEDGVEEAARGQLRHEVGEELEQPLEQPRQAAHARLLGAERLCAAQRGQEELEQSRHELAPGWSKAVESAALEAASSST